MYLAHAPLSRIFCIGKYELALCIQEAKECKEVQLSPHTVYTFIHIVNAIDRYTLPNPKNTTSVHIRKHFKSPHCGSFHKLMAHFACRSAQLAHTPRQESLLASHALQTTTAQKRR
jgi:hypothetical protein